MSENKKILEATELHTWFPVTGGFFQRTLGYVKAVNGVNFFVAPGEIVGVVGESGCGKSTLGYSLLGLIKPRAGTLKLLDQNININKFSSWQAYRKDFQLIFQDPYTSLNPRHTVFEILSEPLLVHRLFTKKNVKEKVADLLEKVGLSADYMFRFPHAFSGGQRQRLGIARAIGLGPKLIICDEIVAALDVSVQAQIIKLLLDLKREMGLSLVFISHDLSLVRAISDRCYVMYMGKIVETATTTMLFSSPSHPYTKALLASIPTLDQSRRPVLLKGEIQTQQGEQRGCAFANRCPKVQSKCLIEEPSLMGPSNPTVSCFFPH